jgi:hypothetical protein
MGAQTIGKFPGFLALAGLRKRQRRPRPDVLSRSNRRSDERILPR